MHTTVSYTFAERVRGVDLDLDRINGDFDVGTHVGRRIDVRGFAAWQVMRDGLRLGPQEGHPELTLTHDRFARASFLQAGGGLSVGLRRNLDLTLSGFATVSGRNVHAVRAIVSGLTWKFGGNFKVVPLVRLRAQ